MRAQFPTPKPDQANDLSKASRKAKASRATTSAPESSAGGCGPVATARHAQSVGVGTGDVAGRVADDQRPLSGIRPPAPARPAPRDRRQARPVLAVRAEGALPGGEIAPDPRPGELEPGDRLVVAGEQAEHDVVALGEPVQQLGHAGENELAEIGRDASGVGAAARLSDGVGARVDPLRRDAGVESGADGRSRRLSALLESRPGAWDRPRGRGRRAALRAGHRGGPPSRGRAGCRRCRRAGAPRLAGAASARTTFRARAARRRRR